MTCLQSDIDAVLHWSEQWLLPLNVSKLQHLHIGWRHACPAYYCGAVLIKSVEEVTDLGVVFTNSLRFNSHISRVCKKANSVCALLFRAFECRDISLLSSLFVTYVRPILECCTSVWSPRIKLQIKCVERVQRLFTKHFVRDVPYSVRLQMLGLHSLEHRRLYFDLVLLFKIVHGFSGDRKSVV